MLRIRLVSSHCISLRTATSYIDVYIILLSGPIGEVLDALGSSIASSNEGPMFHLTFVQACDSLCRSPDWLLYLTDNTFFQFLEHIPVVQTSDGVNCGSVMPGIEHGAEPQIHFPELDSISQATSNRIPHLGE